MKGPRRDPQRPARSRPQRTKETRRRQAATAPFSARNGRPARTHTLDRVQEHLPRSPNARKDSTVRGVLRRAPARIRRGPASVPERCMTSTICRESRTVPATIFAPRPTRRSLIAFSHVKPRLGPKYLRLGRANTAGTGTTKRIPSTAANRGRNPAREGTS
jgi:hypothetical protein